LEVDAADARPLKITDGSIRFDDIGFSYNPSNAGQPKLFDNFSLSIEAGEKIALVGSSGSGKSTLTKLLFRFLDPQQGTLSFDGMPAKAFTLTALRQQISM